MEVWEVPLQGTELLYLTPSCMFLSQTHPSLANKISSFCLDPEPSSGQIIPASLQTLGLPGPRGPPSLSPCCMPSVPGPDTPNG